MYLGVRFSSRLSLSFLLTHTYISGWCSLWWMCSREIRFSISPELIVAMLFCPAMLIVRRFISSEVNSSVPTKATDLVFDMVETSKDPTPRDADGSVRTAVTAIDALDGRRMGRHFPSQWKMNNILRELNKAYAGFVPESTESLKRFQELGTGNWYVFFFPFSLKHKRTFISFVLTRDVVRS